MKSLKVLVSVLALGLMASAPMANAQEKRGGMPTAEQQIERIEQAVGSLTAEQKDKIKAIYTKLGEKMRGVAKEERKEKGMAMLKETRDEVRAVLTKEQQKKFDAMGAGERGGGGGKRKKDQ